MNPLLRKQGTEIFEITLSFPEAVRTKWDFKPGLMSVESSLPRIAQEIARVRAHSQEFRDSLGRFRLTEEILASERESRSEPQVEHVLVIRGERALSFSVDSFAATAAKALAALWGVTGVEVLWIEYPKRI